MAAPSSARPVRAGAIVVGAGGGRRLGGVEKAFFPVGGRPLLTYALDAFEAARQIDAVCVVVSETSIDRAQQLLEGRYRKVVCVVAGGRERQDSVRAGLEALHACDVVAVHDAARPLIGPDSIDRLVLAARASGAAIAGSPVRDTLKRAATQPGVEGAVVVEQTVDRQSVWGAQTPQVFQRNLLLTAFERAGESAGAFTDDASMVEALGHPVQLVDTGVINLKVTYPEDVPLVEVLLRARGDGRLR